MRKKEKNELAFGIHAIIEAIETGKEIEKVFIKKGLKSPLLTTLFNLVQKHNIPWQYVPVEKLNRIRSTTHQGVIAYISPIEYGQLETFIPSLYESGRSPMLLILDGVTDVRNFGAIVRTAECAGVDAIIFPLKGGAMVNADAIKTSAGAIHGMTLIRVPDIKKTIRLLQESGMIVVGATEKSNDSYISIDYSVPFALVMGGEEQGLSEEILATADYLVQIPLHGRISSLNVSVATGICLFEALRQRAVL